MFVLTIILPKAHRANREATTFGQCSTFAARASVNDARMSRPYDRIAR
jgi:hypothetical protein